MFYETGLNIKQTGNQVSALVSLTPAESKRLIGKAVAQMTEVKAALKNGMVIIARGTTNAFVAEEIIGIKIDPKSDEYCRGCIVEGELRATTNRADERKIGNDFILKKGKPITAQPQDAIKEFTGNDVFIKGASAIDTSGQAAVLVAGTEGGTIGWALPTVIGRGAHLIVPVGLEKLVPSVMIGMQKCGVYRFKYSTGLPCALFPLTNAQVVTEIQALAILTGITATHVASGGIGGSEGTVVLAIESNESDLDKTMELITNIKGEPALTVPKKMNKSAASVNYDAAAIRNG